MCLARRRRAFTLTAMRRTAVILVAVVLGGCGASGPRPPATPSASGRLMSAEVAAATRHRAESAVIAGAEQSTDAVALSSMPAPRLARFGVYVPGFPGDAAAIDRAEAVAGRHADIVEWFVHWGGPWSAVNPADLQTVVTRGSTPLITWMTDDPTAPGYPDPGSQTALTQQRIVEGRYDDYIRTWGRALGDLGLPVLLRLDHEMNGGWYAWSPGVGDSTAAGYVAMWRHVHDVIAGVGATNVRWVWSPIAGTAVATTPAADAYPGDDVVDEVGLDVYNWGTGGPGGWRSFRQLTEPLMGQLRVLTARPVLITEVASTDSGGDKGAWVTDFLRTLSRWTDVDGFVWFDDRKERDWRIDSSASARHAFGAAMALVDRGASAGRHRIR